MMKKLFAVVLAMLLALGCMSAVAEEAAPYTAYVHPVLGYTLEYPTEWLVVDTETLPALMTLAQQGGVEGIDLSMLGNLEAQIKSTNMTMFLDMANGANINIGAQDVGMQMTNDLFLTGMMPMLKAQYEQMFANAVFEDEGSIVTIGENEYCYMSMSYTANGQTLCAEQFYLIDGTVMYIISGTYGADLAETGVLDDMGMILATFALAK